MPVTLESPRSTVLRNVPWALYVHMRDQVDSQTQVTYDRGRMEIMSPVSYRHDHDKSTVALLADQFLIDKRIPFDKAGGMTLSSELLDRGCEPDESYYVLAEPPPVGTREIDLAIHNAPDLVIEVDLTSHSVDKEPIYAAMGVAELWRWESDRLKVLCLRADGSGYDLAGKSRALPSLPLDLLAEHVRMGRALRQSEVVRRWRAEIATVRP